MRSEDLATAKVKLADKIKFQLFQYTEKEKGGECQFDNLIANIYVAYGSPVEEILDQAKQGNYDLIVMGTHGHGFLYSALIGSTAKKMVQKSHIPVLVVRLPE